MSEISPRQRLLHVIPYDKFVPPQNGGALRCYHLCKELSKHFEVTLLTFQDKTTFHKYDLGNVNIINPNFYRFDKRHFPTFSQYNVVDYNR